MAVAKRPQKKMPQAADKSVRALGKKLQVEATAREAVDARVVSHKGTIASASAQTFGGIIHTGVGGSAFTVAYCKAGYHATGIEAFIATTQGGVPATDHTIRFFNLTSGESGNVAAPAADFSNGRISKTITLEVKSGDEISLACSRDASLDIVVNALLTGDKPRREREIARDGG